MVPGAKASLSLYVGAGYRTVKEGCLTDFPQPPKTDRSLTPFPRFSQKTYLALMRGDTFATVPYSRNYDRSGNGSMWVQPAYDWGYADNDSERDCADAVNSLDIDNAIDILGKPIKLEYIDFVKIQSAVQSKSGWLGELSTEVCNIVEIM